MRYGLPKEENSKKKWKSAIENELKGLKIEVCLLQDQLDEANKKITELTSSKPSDPFAFIQDFPRRDESPLFQCSNNVTNSRMKCLTHALTNKSVNPEVKPCCNLNATKFNEGLFTSDFQSNQKHNEGIFTCNFQSHKKHNEGIFTCNFQTNKKHKEGILTCDFQSNKKHNEGIFTCNFQSNKKHNEGLFTSNLQSPQENPFATTALGTQRPRYHSIWDYDPVTRKAVRMQSISCMPSYIHKSFEQLRYEDYSIKGIGISNKLQRCIDSKLRSSRSEKNNFSLSPNQWKPSAKKHSECPTDHTPFMIPWYISNKLPKAHWPFGPSSNEPNPFASDSVSAGPSGSSWEFNLKAETNKPESVLPFQSISKPNNGFDFGNTTKNEDFSSQVLLELKKMEEKMSSIDDRLSKMDSNLSDISTRVCVMDSRLSVVDMFVTMQRFDKKWQGLESRLASLENPPHTTAVTLSTGKSTSKETVQIVQKDASVEGIVVHQESKSNVSSTDSENNNTLQSFKVGKSGSALGTIKSEETGLLSTTGTSDMNLSDFVRSISCTDINMGSKILNTSGSSDNSGDSASSSKISLEMADLKSNPRQPENLSLQENQSTITSVSVPANIKSSKEKDSSYVETQSNNTPVSIDIIGFPIDTKPVQNSKLQSNSSKEDSNNWKKTNDPLGAIEVNDSSSKTTNNIDNGSGSDSEFEIVEKSDVEELVEENLKTETLDLSSNQHLDEAASSAEFKIYNDITEYLEINLGKKKNLVYEFGFEAKPGYVFKSEGSPGADGKSLDPQENKAGTPSGDDSFQQFRSNFMENKSVDAKQSSPFVFFSKASEEPPAQRITRLRRKIYRWRKIENVERCNVVS